MRVNTNMNALIANNAMGKNTALAGNSMEKISSGLRITKAGDDAAGLAISEKMRSQIRGLDQAGRNVQDGISLIQTAEGGMEEVTNILQRMRELTVQGANGTNTAEEVANIQKELSELGAEVKRIGDTTSFNGKKVLNGKNATIDVQAGANHGEKLTINLTDVSTIALSVQNLSVTDLAAANKSTSLLDAKLKAINTGRATLGAQQNRLEYTQNNLTTSSENLSLIHI